MLDLPKLHDKLLSVVPETDFKLDERSAQTLLTQLQAYTRLIPFDDESPQNFWDAFWFLNNQTPESLAQIYNDLQQADGNMLPHQGWLLAVLQLLETPRALLNTIPARHRALYYREVLGLVPRTAQADRLALRFQLRNDITNYLLPAGTRFAAGQDSNGTAVSYALDADILLSSQQLSHISWTRQESETNTWLLCIAEDSKQQITLPENGIRFFASTDNETALQNESRVTLTDMPLLAGPLQVELRFADGANLPDSDVIITQQQESAPIVCHLKQANHYTFTLPQGFNQNTHRWTLRYPPTSTRPALDSIRLRLTEKQGVRYRSSDNQGSLQTFSYPFGVTALSGNGFELQLPTALCQRGGTLTLTPEWRDLPGVSFCQLYQHYPFEPASNEDFVVQAWLLTAEEKQPLGEPQPLFTGTEAPQGRPLRFILPAQPDITAPVRLRVELGDKTFQQLAWQTNPADKKPPYIPQVSGFTVDFQLSLSAENTKLAPRSLLADAPGFNKETALYLGFKNTAPGETLSLYWSIDAPSPLKLDWSYSTTNGWSLLESAIDDDTENLSTSGLWKITLPEDITRYALADTEELYWLKATPVTTDDSDDENTPEPNAGTSEMPKLIAVWANAMTATLNEVAEIADSWFSKPLAAGTVTRPVNTISEISQVSQPLASWGGRPAEQQSAFYQRAASRISHRHRAVTWGDMRTLLLDNYPQILDVKLPGIQTLTAIPAPINQQLVIIPNNHYADNDDPLRPQLSSGRLKKMQLWLKTLTTEWASPTLINPTYVQVTARYDVEFRDGINDEYGEDQLKKLLNEKFNPWSANLDRGVTPGNQIDYFQVLATLQGSPLVKQVKRLTLERENTDPSTKNPPPSTETLSANEHEVLVLNLEKQDTSQNGDKK